MTCLAHQRSLGRSARAWLIALVLGAGTATLCPPPAEAQSKADLSRARQLYRQGLSLEAAGNWSSALQKFEEVAKVKLTPQVRFHIARCKENLGRLNEALGEYKIAEFEAAEAGAKELGEITSAREKLEARVPKLVITRGAGTESASILLDGVEIGEAKIGKEVSVDPGPHTITTKYRDGRKFDKDVSVAEGETKSIELVPPEGFDKARPVDEEEDDEEDEPVEDTGVTAKADEGSSVLPWVIGGAGVASLIASGVFFTLRNGAESDLDDVCRGSVCPKSSEDKQSSGETYATLTGITLGVGVVGVGVAVVMLLSGDSKDVTTEGRSGVSVDVASSSRFTGVNVAGRF